MTDFKPGDVVVHPEHGRGIVFSTGYAEFTARGLRVGQIADDLRRLVVIDPESAEDVERLANLMWTHRANILHDLVEVAYDALREFANPTPPKPDEPAGLGAVVEDTEGRKWVSPNDLDAGGRWWFCGDEPERYDDIDAVRVLSEGITP